MSRKRHIVVVAGLLGLSCLVQVLVIRRATVPGLDAVRFVGVAQAIDEQGLLQTLRAEREQPLFSVWVWIVHAAVEGVAGEFHSAWAVSAQLAAAIPLVLAVVPAYLLMLRLVGSAAALAGSLLFCLLPEVSRLGADGISDSAHLLFFCVAFWAMVEYFRGQESGARSEGSGARSEDSQETRGGWGRAQRCPSASSSGAPPRSAPATHFAPVTRITPAIQPMWLLVAGVAVAVSVLARAEVLVLAATLGLVLGWFQLLAGRRQAWKSLAGGLGCFVLGLAPVLGPYLAAVGSVTPRAAVGRVLGRSEAEDECLPPATPAAAWRTAGGQQMSFDAKERSVSARRRGYPAAAARFGRKLADVFGYWVGVLALFGAWRLRRWPASNADRFVQLFFLVFSMAAIWFTATEGYLVPRHLLALVVAGLGSAGFGALELGSCLKRVPPAANWSYPPVAWAVVVLAGVACLPQTLIRHHDSRLGHREAGQWLALQAGAADTVLDTRGWTGLYSGRETYLYEEARAALCDPHLVYLVLEESELGFDSDRSRTLRHLVETAARPVAEFPDPAVRKPNQQPVVVCRWYPDRFGRRVAAGRVSPHTKEDRDARADRSIRR